MTRHAALLGLTGSWTGTSHLWLRPDDPPADSVSLAEITTLAGDAFLSIAYTWEYDGPQDGLILLNVRTGNAQTAGVWLDSFHTAPGLMPVRTTIDEQGIAVQEGSYSAPPGPDWGWRIVIDPTPAPDFHLLMFNITPEGDLYKAVEVVYQRLSPAS